VADWTQTNEPGRCASLLPLLASLPQSLALVEVGASAGLCLYPDRYSYRYATSVGEHRLGDSEVILSCAVTGPVLLPTRLPEVVWRAGLDLNPLLANSADDRRWLASLVWPEQIDRAERLDRALDLVAAEPPRLVAGDLLVDLPRLLAEAPLEATLVVFHSAVLAYLDQEERSRFTDVMRIVKGARDVHWVSNEAPRGHRWRRPESKTSRPVHPRPRPGASCRDRTPWPQPRLASSGWLVSSGTNDLGACGARPELEHLAVTSAVPEQDGRAGTGQRPSLVRVVPPVRRVPLAVIERASHPLVPSTAKGQLADAAVRVQGERFTPHGGGSR